MLHRHFCLLGRWNTKINLTAIRRPEEVVERHYCESLFFAAQLPDVYDTAARDAGGSGVTVADIGSGAGFPGVPLAIVRPGWRVTLVESHQRKSVFLRETSRGLVNVEVLNVRAQAIERHFDWIVSRAVDPEEVLALAPQRSSCLGLMLGLSDAEKVTAKVGAVRITPVPWSAGRVCLYSV